MINLLNPEHSAELKAARLNFRLRRYMALAIVATAGIVAIYGAGYWSASSEYNLAKKQNEAAQSELKTHESLKKRMSEYRANLAIADKILDTQLEYSDFLVYTAQAMPSNTILASVGLSTKELSMPGTQRGILSLDARTKSYNDAIDLKTSLEASSLFSEVSFRDTSTTLTETSTTNWIDREYPYRGSYTVRLDLEAKVNP